MNIVSLKSALQLSEKPAQAGTAEGFAAGQHPKRIVPEGSSVAQARQCFGLWIP